MSDVLIDVKHIVKSFLQPGGADRLTVLKDVSLAVRRGTIVAVTGASGSGKSTLLHLMGGLDTPDSGDILVEGESLLGFGRKERTRYRNRRVGFVFQFHYLMPELTVRENTAFPALMKEFDKKKAYARAEALLKEVGLSERMDYMPYQLSGGERQRAAIARGLINAPDLLLADEPTGNLDWNTGTRVFDLFKDLLKERKLTAVIVTHNEELARLADERYHLHEGRLE